MPNAVRILSDAEAAYIAGIVDGEGTVSLVRHHGRERRRPVVSVANTERDLLTYLRETIGAGRITSKRVTKDHHTPSFVFAIYSRQALTPALLEARASFEDCCFAIRGRTASGLGRVSLAAGPVS